MIHTVNDQLLSRFSQFVADRFGLHFSRKRWGDLARKIVSLADDFGFADPSSCVQWLISAELTRSQLDILAGRLTIGETYFFRERNSFDALEAQVLPALISSRRGKEQRVRIWSAGCSTGEEAYSMAILLRRMIPDLAAWNVTILATDLNRAALRKAVQGEYSDWSFRGIPHWVRERYFTRNGHGRFELAEPVRKMVTFSQLNLAEDPYPSLSNNSNAMDIIFCRNVLMYFTPHQAEKVVERFHHSLVADGWLIVSPCEASHTLFSRFETVISQGAILYRKSGDRERGGVSALPAAAIPELPLIADEQLPGTASSSLPAPQPARPMPAPTTAEQSAEPAVSAFVEAEALYRQGRYAEAAAMLAGQRAGGEGGAGLSSAGQAATLLARIYANLGDFPAALEWTDKAFAVNKLDPELHYLQAIIYQEQGAVEAAVTALKKTLYLDQRFVLAHFALANLTLRQGKAEEAARHLENAAALLATCGDDDIVPGSEGLSARRLGEIIAATRASAVE